MKVCLLAKIKTEILDPQGKALEASIHRLGVETIRNVRVGKVIEFEIEGMTKEQASTKINELCEQILINPLLEDVSYEFKD
ncbi:MAG: phosphoribosylformylglycinamidine synthase subunit PurS [Bdellovibrionales bacterium]|nr:phosphoribosylformylglycinamidine synthase subunit PurS [Bdellovibrionales bacterium]